MIRFGPAGIPLSCKGRTLREGVIDVHTLSLTAIEIQMVRPNVMELYPDEDIVGKTMNTIEDAMVLEILRDDESIIDPDEPIEEEDILIAMTSPITESFGQLAPIGTMAKRLDIDVSLHTPNYIDLGSNSPLTDKCMDDIRHAGLICNALQGNVVVTNLGLYDGKTNEEEIDDNILDNLAAIVEWWQDCGLKPKIGVEITGRSDVFGSLDQVLDVCDQFDGTVIPVLNFPHYHSRTNGSLVDVSDFENLIQQVLPYNNNKLYAHFAGVEHAEGDELRLTPIKKGDLKFEQLADCLADSRPDATIISSSPLLEHDAMYMRIIYERMVNKRVAKSLRAKKKEAEAAAAAAAVAAAAEAKTEDEQSEE
ncbi:MAG: TIM barrel protein [Candidatus Methanomethylophilaceae archaeon]|nr:TIM barrel protein [Candidatus Methanomethylophilaceae archaeon]